MSQRKLILAMQITLDGYVADLNDEADWLISDDASSLIELGLVDEYRFNHIKVPARSRTPETGSQGQKPAVRKSVKPGKLKYERTK